MSKLLVYLMFEFIIDAFLNASFFEIECLLNVIPSESDFTTFSSDDAVISILVKIYENDLNRHKIIIEKSNAVHVMGFRKSENAPKNECGFGPEVKFFWRACIKTRVGI